MRPMSLVVLVAAACGCNRLETAREISSAVAECDTTAVGALSLTPGNVRRVQAPSTPSGIVFTSRDTILAIDGKSSGLSVYAGDSAPTWLSAPEPLRTITRAGTDVLVASARTIYRVHEARIERVARIPQDHGDIVSLAADRNSVWAATDGGTTSPAQLLTAFRRRPHRWSDIPIPRPVRLEVLEGGRIAAAEIAAPHHIRIFDDSLRRRAIVAPMPRAPQRSVDSAAWFTQSLVRLDCGRLLQVITDHRSMCSPGTFQCRWPLLALTLAGALASAPSAAAAQSGPRVPQFRIQQVLSLGGDFAGENTSFADVEGIGVSRSGNLYVLDGQDRSVRVFDARGRFIRRFGRQGGGPGEFQVPTGIWVDSIVGVSDGSQQRMSYFTLDGRHLRTVPAAMAGESPVLRLRPLRHGRAVGATPARMGLSANGAVREGSPYSAVVLVAGGAVSDTLLRMHSGASSYHPEDAVVPFGLMPSHMGQGGAYAVLGDSVVATVDGYSGTVHWYRVTPDDVRQFRTRQLPSRSRAVTSDDRRRIERLIRARSPNLPRRLAIETPPQVSIASRALFSDEGFLWNPQHRRSGPGVRLDRVWTGRERRLPAFAPGGVRPAARARRSAVRGSQDGKQRSAGPGLSAIPRRLTSVGVPRRFRGFRGRCRCFQPLQRAGPHVRPRARYRRACLALQSLEVRPDRSGRGAASGVSVSTQPPNHLPCDATSSSSWC